MKLILSALAAVLLFLIPEKSNAQCRLNLQGTVTDESDGSVLEFVTIYLVEAEKGSMTDSLGRFLVKEICPGTYTVRVSHVGCETVEKVMDITDDTVVALTLPHSASMLQSVQITSEKTRKQIAPAPVITGTELDRTRGSTLAGSLQSVSGVSTLKTGSTIEKPVIHGLYGNRVLIYNNGVRLESQQWGSEHAPEVDPFVASSLTVVKGAGSVRYGSDAIGGVILAEASPLRDSAGTGGQIDLAGFTNGRGGVFSGMLEHRFAKLDALALRIQGTLKRAGNINSADYYLKNTGMSEFDFSWAASWKKRKYGVDVWYSQYNSELAIFSGSHIGNLTDFENAIQSDEPYETSGFSYKIDRPWQNVEHELVKAGGYLITGPGSKLTATYSRQYNLREEYDKDVPLDDSLAALNLPELSYELTSHIADISWEHFTGDAFKGQAGVTGQYSGNTFEGRYFIPNYVMQTAAAYLTERWTGSSAGIEAGVRYEAKSMDVYINTGDEVVTESYNYGGLTGTLGASYKFSKSFEVLLNLSSAWRAPSANELYADGLHHGAAAVEIGDKSLDEEQALNVSMDVAFRPADKLSLELTAYHSLFNGFIYLQPELPPTVIVQGTFPTYYYRQADATVSGLDFHAEWKVIQRLKLDLRAAGVVARNTDSEEYLPGFPPFRFGGGAEYFFRDLKGITGMSAGFHVEHVAEQTRVPDQDDYVAPPPAYTLFSAVAACTVRIVDLPVKFTLSAENLFNASYRDYLNRYRYYADDMGRNLILRIKVPF